MLALYKPISRIKRNINFIFYKYLVRADKCHENSIMRSRLLTIHKGFASISQSRKLATKPVRCQPHMNELPVPCGPWDPWYRQKQSYFMKHLLLGLAWWLFSFGMAIYTESLYLNFSPPAFPSPPSDFVEECDDSDS